MLGATLQEGLRPGLEGRVLVDVGEEPHVLDPGLTEQTGEPAATVRLGVDVCRDPAHDAVGQRAIRVGHGDGPEVLVLDPDAAAAPGDARHLRDDAQRVGDVQDHGDREHGVEAAALERQRGAVRLAQRDPAARPPASLPRLAQDQAARVNADDAPARARDRGEVTDDDPCAAAHLEDRVAGADGNEAQESPSQARLGRGAPAQLQRGGQLRRVGLRVDVAAG